VLPSPQKLQGSGLEEVNTPLPDLDLSFPFVSMSEIFYAVPSSSLLFYSLSSPPHDLFLCDVGVCRLPPWPASPRALIPPNRVDRLISNNSRQHSPTGQTAPWLLGSGGKERDAAAEVCLSEREDDDGVLPALSHHLNFCGRDPPPLMLVSYPCMSLPTSSQTPCMCPAKGIGAFGRKGCHKGPTQNQ
jgi:hypothetical protein